MVKVTMTKNNYLRAPTVSVGTLHYKSIWFDTVYSGCEIQVKEILCCFFSFTFFTEEFQYFWYMLQETTKDGRPDCEVETIYWKDVFVKQYALIETTGHKKAPSCINFQSRSQSYHG